MQTEKAEHLWASLSNDEKDYLLGKYALTTLEARTLLGISRARLGQLLSRGQLKYIKTDASGTIYALHEIERRMKEAEPYRNRGPKE